MWWSELPAWQQALAWFLAWAAAGLVVSQVAHWLWGKVFLTLAKRTRTDLDEALLAATRTPARLVIITTALYMGAQVSFVGLPEITGHPAWAIGLGVIYVSLVLAVTFLVYAGVSAIAHWHSTKAAAKAGSSIAEQFGSAFRKIAKLLCLFVALTIIFGHFGVQITGLLATAGVASLAIAFAAQETIANMIAGFVLMVDRPFQPGDRVQLANGQVGDVLEVGLRSTRVLSFDNTVITIPNAEIAKSQIINFNAPDPNVKIRCTLGVAYGSDLRRVKAVLLEVMDKHSDVLRVPEPAVFFTEFAESSLNLLFVCWVADYRDKFRILDELNMAIKDRFEAEGINIPFPQREVNLRWSEPGVAPNGRGLCQAAGPALEGRRERA